MGRVEAERCSFVVAEVAARVHAVLRQHLEVLGVALLHRVGHCEAISERVVALAERDVEAEEDAGEAVEGLVGVVVELLRRVVPESSAVRGWGGAVVES